MFGSTNPFGQSSTTSPFTSQSVFGQTSSASTNHFAQKPFGSPNPFGSSTGSSLFGGTSTGVFGQPSTPAFGSSSAPAFGSSTPAFAASTNPAFGSSSSSFGGSSLFGQKPSFGGFGSTPSQTNPFGSTYQQTQPAFGSNSFGSTTPFGASSQPAFGATSSPAFGSTSNPNFGATTGQAFGATTSPAFGATTSPAFGSTTTSLFGSTGMAFGVPSTPAFGSAVTPAFGAQSTSVFGSSSTPAFGAQSTSVFGSSSTPAFGATSTPTFGSSTAPAFGASSTSSLGFGSTPSLGQSTSRFSSTPFGTTPSPFGAQSSPFGAQTATSAFGSSGFGQSSFGGQQGGSRAAAYTPTPETDGASGTQANAKLETISAMAVYKDKSHEELRWEDYRRGDKGGPSSAGQPAGGVSFPAKTQTSPFGSVGTFGQPAANPFSSAASSNIFAPKTLPFGSTGFGSTSTSVFNSPFSASSSSPFGSTSSSTSLFGASSGPAFVSSSSSSSSSSPFGGSTTPALSSSPLIVGSSAVGSNSAFGSSLTLGNTHSSGLCQPSTPSIGQTPSPFGQPATGFQQTTPSFSSNLFSTASTGFGGSLFSNSVPSILPTSNHGGFGQTKPSLSAAFQPAAPTQTSNAFSFGNFGQTQPASLAGYGSTSSILGQGTFGQLASTQSNMVMQPVPFTNPFGTLPALPQMSTGQGGSAPSVQYGISSMPVAEKPTPVRISTLSAPRHLSQRRIRLPARKYNPKNDGPKVPFFMDDEETPTTPKADALFIPRENPRSLVILPIEQWPSRTCTEKQSMLKDMHDPATENGEVSGKPAAMVFNGILSEDHDANPAGNGHIREQNLSPLSPSNSVTQKPIGVPIDHSQETDSSYIMISGHRAGEAAIVYEHGADIEALMPKLRHADYYTEPRIQELAAKEQAEPGFCRRVKDFVVGRHGCGSIKFDGETDVRRLDFESIVQFNNREVIVYREESRRPPVGQGLNKPAEVTLLNVKCIDKKTGEQYSEGPKVDKYKEMLMKKAEEQGAEFASFDAVKGLWKFKVRHFSCYKFEDGYSSDGSLVCDT